MKAPQNKVVLLVGPTGVGKTETAVLLAEALRTEIISADSMQVYRHMDIGTEKPPPALRKRVRHHMIDMVEPWETFSAGRYVEAVAPIIEGLLKDAKTPVVTGGTGLYIKALTRGLFKGPAADWSLREELLKEDAPALYERLIGLDPEAASSIMPADKRRTVRALEVCLKSGRRISELKKSLTSPLPYVFVKVALARDRAELYPMIERRVDSMLQRGLVAEVKKVLSMDPSRTPMQAIGYKEIAAHLEARYGLEEAAGLIKRNTKRYAKRQFTWFKKEEGMAWVDITGLSEPSAALERIWPVLRAGGILG